ncbi:hypothetical protein ACJMK2_009741 [Sinanodonta woodiana]|uniref:TOX high mobility group box family member 2 n=1 Tax=Sinanodonta woodiana TaxID=1069815 RepID=A0ABD3VG86_SINWO
MIAFFIDRHVEAVTTVRWGLTILKAPKGGGGLYRTFALKPMVYKKKTEVAKKEYLKQLAAYRASLVSQTTFDDQGHNEVTSSPPRLSPHRMTTANLSSPDGQLGMMTDMSPPHPQVYGMESPRHQGVMGALSPSHPALQNGSSPPHMKYGNGSPQYTIMDSPSHVMSQPLQQQGMVTYHHQSPQHSLPYSSPPLHGDLSPVSAEPSSGGILAPGMCIRNGCTNRAIDNVGWDSEYCSNECVVSHCRDVFTAWVAARQVTGNSYIIK